MSDTIPGLPSLIMLSITKDYKKVAWNKEGSIVQANNNFMANTI